ncbi:12837_t:CDS:2, partial [Racocetra fulgida]
MSISADSIKNNDDILFTNNDYVFDEILEIDSKRLRALHEIDNANFQWFHIRACVVSGVGFFADAYDLFVINLVSTMIGYSYFNHDGEVPASIDMGLKMSAACGTLVGQLFFGWSADHYGRKKAMMAAVFAMQGFGILSAAIVSVVTLSIFKNEITRDFRYIDYVWRVVLGFGVLPAVIALYFRLTIPETPRYTMDVLHDIEKAKDDIDALLVKDRYMDAKNKPIYLVEAPRATWEDFKNYFSQWKNGKLLLGTSISWFVLDVAFYGIGLNNAIILQAIGFGNSSDHFSTLWNMSVGNIIINMLGTVPGYWLTVFLVDRWGRKSIQIMGFAILTILFLIMGFAYDAIVQQSV